jgi:hypothetical protein
MNKIELISYNLKQGIESYYFACVETLPVLNTINRNRHILFIQCSSSTLDGKYLDEKTAKNWQTIGDLQAFFKENPHYYIDDFELELDNNFKITSHDDGEITFEFPQNSKDQDSVNDFLKQKCITQEIIDYAKARKGRYIQLDDTVKITACYFTFDSYVKDQEEPW